MILGLDTTLDTFSLALVSAEDERTLAQWTGGQPRQHLTQLFQALQALLDVHHLKMENLTGIAVTTGPGSFTGVRLGVLVARTLGQVGDLPLYPVDATLALAANAPKVEKLAVSLDARKGEVFVRHFRDGLPEGPGKLVKPGEWADELQPGTWVLGSAAQRFGLPEHVVVCPPGWSRVQAEWVARLRGRQVTWRELDPEYLRAADVQVQAQVQVCKDKTS